MKFFESIGDAFTPKFLRPHLREYLAKAGLHSEPHYQIGVVSVASFVVSALIYTLFVTPRLVGLDILSTIMYSFLSFTIISLVIIGFAFLVIYFYIDLLIYSRVREIEEILPDYLQLVSTNVKSGLSFEYALWYAIKPKFGVLAVEMQFVLKKVMTGYELTDALVEFSKKYNSPTLQRTVHLLIGELDSGGKISHILDSVVTNLKNNQKMRAEMAASAITYIIFIGSIVVVIAPVLFALSYNLLGFIDSFVTKIAASGGLSDSAFKISPGAISLSEFRIFSAVAIGVISVLSSMIVAIIERGDVRAGLKYIPIFLVGAGLCYFLATVILTTLFGGITF
jgi:Flp pilus assembly protein TadB